MNQEKNMDGFFEELEEKLWHEFPRYFVKISQFKVSFFVLVKKPCGKILNGDMKYLCDNVRLISEDT